jgi:hypothetical protein
VKQQINPHRNEFRRGLVTVEMLAMGIAILIPFLLALSELTRLDLAARRLQFAAQQSCLVAAVSGNADPAFRLVPVESSASVAMRPEVVTLLKGGRTASVTLMKRYWIATGTGYGDFGD